MLLFPTFPVVPYVGTWIEIDLFRSNLLGCLVVPYVGTWIEIYFESMEKAKQACRSLRGNVDRNTTS